VHWEYGDLDAAIASARKSLDLDPGFPDGLYVLGAVLAEQGRLADYGQGLPLDAAVARAAGRARTVPGLAGTASAIFVLVAIASAFVVSLRLHWMWIAVRVAGSWVTAIGLPMLGWSLRG